MCSFLFLLDLLVRWLEKLEDIPQNYVSMVIYYGRKWKKSP